MKQPACRPPRSDATSGALVARIRALLSQLVPRRQPVVTEAPIILDEKAELLAALDPPYRVYVRDEAGQVRCQIDKGSGRSHARPSEHGCIK